MGEVETAQLAHYRVNKFATIGKALHGILHEFFINFKKVKKIGKGEGGGGQYFHPPPPPPRPLSVRPL